jgi:hypothetical protein
MKLEVAVTELRTRKAHCNACGGERNHHVLHADKTRWEAEEDGVTGGTNYEMLKCAGCDKVVLREHEWCSEQEPTIRFYPPSTFRPQPKWLTELWLELAPGRELVHDLLTEVYVALQNAQPMIAAMGIRALLERMMIEKVKDNGSFARNLLEFQNAGYISPLQREQIETALEVGHAAIHRGYKPTQEDLSTIVDLTEVLIQSIYLHGSKVKELKGRVPPRKTP